MDKNRASWEDVTRHDLEYVKEKILTGYKDGKPFTAMSLPADLQKLITIDGDIHRSLDFGCGVGRNFPLLRSFSNVVEGYDLPGMIEMCKREATADYLESDWSQVKSRRYDVIFASLVFQHILPETLAEYLRDMATMTRYVLVAGRTTFDEPVGQPTVWKFIESQGYRQLYDTLSAGTHQICLFQPEVNCTGSPASP